MKSTNENVIQIREAERPSTWGWSIEDDDSMLLRSDPISASAVWGGSAIHLRWPEEDAPLN